MLSFLSIRNIVLIEKIDINFEQGLCVLTGETGAGKSIILDSLGLVLGNRANYSLRPKNQFETKVTAVFSNIQDLEIEKILRENGIDLKDEIILKRSLTSDGKSKSFINDNLVSLSTLKNIGDKLVEVESQFSEQGLLNTSSHIKVLDEFGNYNNLIIDLNKSWDVLQEKTLKLKTMQNLKIKINENKELYNFYLNELSNLNPSESEYPKLLKAKELLVNSKKIMSSSLIVLDNFFSENNRNIENLMISSIKELEKINKFVGKDCEKIINTIDDFLVNMVDLKNTINSFCENNDQDGKKLESLEDRIFEYVRLAKKHNCQESDLIHKKNSIELELQSLEDESKDLKKIILEKEQAEKIFNDIANEVSLKRIENAKKMDEQINLELPDLKLDGATFKTCIEQSEKPKRDGIDDIKFLIKTNPKSELGHFNKITSGGELCRFALAIKVVSSKIKKNSIVFDEVDSGIGGSVASAVGEKLNRLGKTKQIIVVTHSPQVAALGNQHYKVSKIMESGVNITKIEKLDNNKKILEIARMLSGKEITSEAEEAAKILINTT